MTLRPAASNRRTVRRTVAAWVLPALALVGCSDRGTDPIVDGGDGEAAAVSFATEIQPIFDTHCTVCHGAGGNGGLDLRAGFSHANLVGVVSPNYGIARVAPGDADASLLVRKMSGAAGVGSVMPPTGSLSGVELDLVQRWIAEGARDNPSP